MAIKELFNDNRPRILFDPRATERIDPRFKYTRNSIGTYTDKDGFIATAGVNGPRIAYAPVTGELLGLLLEKSSTNIFTSSQDFTAWGSVNGSATADAALSPSGIQNADKFTEDSSDSRHYIEQVKAGTASAVMCFSVYVKAAGRNYVSLQEATYTSRYMNFDLQNKTITGGNSSAAGSFVEDVGNGWLRLVGYFLNGTTTTNQRWRIYVWPSSIGSTNPLNQATYTGNGSSGIFLWGAQLELATFVTSYIPTTASAVTRAADLLSVETPLPASGSVYIDARAITTPENGALISLKNASNQKINLSYESNAATYNSLALIASYSGTSKSSLPLPVPTTDRERNIITWGAQNYQYGRDSSRYAASLSSSVPANLTQLSIGHDAVDPTKTFNGYINTVYMWNGELTPAVAEALVRGELDPINADTYSPVGPTGSLALVINTQGATASGDKTFTLPAESAANDNDIVITWGDGTESGLDGASAELGAPGLTHTYPAAGIYPVWVEGQLENLKFGNIANAPDLLQIAAWGTTANGNDVFRSPSTMNSAFYGCSQMDFSTSARTTNLPDTSAVTSWYRAFRDCGSITGTFPAFNLSAATTLQEAWQGCSSMTSFIAAGDQTQNVTNFSSAWDGCSSLTSFPLINTAAGTDFGFAWRNCSSLTSFPLINTAAGTNFGLAWYGCSSLTSFPLIDTAAGINFQSAWYGCSSLTSFPLIDTAAGTDFGFAWLGCFSLTSFPLINTAAGTNFYAAWYNCFGLTSFPLINTAAGTDFGFAWRNCSSLTSFPLINTAAGTNFGFAWLGCFSLTSFPLINTAAGTNFYAAWDGCSSLTSFPLIDTSSGTNFREAWSSCSGLTSFPLIDTSSGTSFISAWNSCYGLTSFPLINTAAGTNFAFAWFDNNSLTAFPALDFDAAVGLASDAGNTNTGFRNTWNSCDALADFPANLFDNTTCTRYLDAWTGCALTAQSIENILVSINTANTSNGNLGIGGGTNAAKGDWSTAANNAYDALVARGWTITYNA